MHLRVEAESAPARLRLSRPARNRSWGGSVPAGALPAAARCLLAAEPKPPAMRLEAGQMIHARVDQACVIVTVTDLPDRLSLIRLFLSGVDKFSEPVEFGNCACNALVIVVGQDAPCIGFNTEAGAAVGERGFDALAGDGLGRAEVF